MERIGVITGLRSEAECLDVLAGPERPAAEVAGANTVRARARASALVSRGCRALLSFGVAGGLDPALRAGDLVQFGEVASGYSFGNSSSLELEFGLGQRRQVERIEVAWPSGQVDVYRDIAADQHLVLREGETR